MKLIILLTILLVIAVLPINATEYYDVALSTELQDELFTICETYDVPPELMLALMFVESSYRIDVISRTNDYGLCQINKINHAELSELLGIDDFLDPIQNMTAGAYMLGKYMAEYDGDNVNLTLHAALMCYKLGENGAAKRFKQGVYSNAYSRKVVSVMEGYHGTD